MTDVSFYLKKSANSEHKIIIENYNNGPFSSKIKSIT